MRGGGFAEKHGGGVARRRPSRTWRFQTGPRRSTRSIFSSSIARLEELERLDPEQAKIVELRFFGGLTVEETAVVVGSSPATIKREWAVAKGWLYRELRQSEQRQP